MATLQIEREEELSGAVTLRLRGAFDARSAEALRAALEPLAGREVVLDFTRVGQFQDLAVPILTRGLDCVGLSLRGLSLHHQRLFRYFGVGPSVAPPHSFWQPEEAIAR